MASHQVHRGLGAVDLIDLRHSHRRQPGTQSQPLLSVEPDEQCPPHGLGAGLEFQIQRDRPGDIQVQKT
ncbi:hypothetical protein D3C87_2120710 [compost metagenome]